MKTSKVKFVMPKGEREVNGRQFNQYYVGMENGDKKYFLAVGEFKKKVGEDIEYELKGEYQAKLLQAKQTDNVQIYIIRQSMLKAAIDFHAKNDVDEDTVIETARLFVNYVNQG